MLVKSLQSQINPVDISRGLLIRTARSSPGGFAQVASRGQWINAPHLKLINDKLLQITRGELNRLMVFLPPRHGKSELISKYTPAWYLGMHPDKRVILTSYEADFAAQWGRRARDLLEEHGTIFPIPVKLNPDSSSASRWDIVGNTGGMTTAGARGPITGKGGHLIIIDDPVKNAEESMSTTIQEKTWEWYLSTLYTRLEPNGAIILIMTRWSQNDLAGKLLHDMQAGGERWEIINLPALAEPEDPIGRSEGEALWPARFPRDRLEQMRRTVGSHWWASLYQQRPIPREGGIFKYQYIDTQRVIKTPALIRVVIGVDPAVTSTKESDETGIVAAGLDAAGHCYILGDYSLRGTPLDWARAVVKGFRRHQADRVIGEVNNGGDLVEMNLRQVDPNIPFTKVHASRGKVIRAEPIAALYEQGRVHHLGTFPELEDQMTNWVPGDRSPDRIDALVWALHELTSGEEVQEIIVYDSDYQISPI